MRKKIINNEIGLLIILKGNSINVISSWHCDYEYTVRKSVGEFHSNFSAIFTRFRDIAAFVLQHVTFSHSGLPKIYPRSSESMWMAFRLRRENVIG